MTELTQNLADTLEKYLEFFPHEKEVLGRLEGQIAAGEDLSDRKNMTGHATASGLVFNADGDVLLIAHNFYGRYLQPGGHVDDDLTTHAAARREVEEETGLINFMMHPWHDERPFPFDINTHPIPARTEKNEGEHFHHDSLYLFVTEQTEITLQEDEVNEFRWVSVDELMQYDRRLQKVSRKLQQNTMI